MNYTIFKLSYKHSYSIASKKRISFISQGEQYWPTDDGKVEIFDHIQITNTNETQVFDSRNTAISDTIKRKLEIRNLNEGIYYMILEFLVNKITCVGLSK